MPLQLLGNAFSLEPFPGLNPTQADLLALPDGGYALVYNTGPYNPAGFIALQTVATDGEFVGAPVTIARPLTGPSPFGGLGYFEATLFGAGRVGYVFELSANGLIGPGLHNVMWNAVSVAPLAPPTGADITLLPAVTLSPPPPFAAREGIDVITLQGGGTASAFVTGVNVLSTGPHRLSLQIRDANGVALGPLTVVHEISNGQMFSVKLAPLADGGFIALWEQATAGAVGSDLMVARYNAQGVQTAAPAAAMTATEFASNPRYISLQPQIAIDANGRYAIAAQWTVPGFGDGDGSGVVVAFFDAAGARVATALANTTTAGNQTSPVIETLADGTFLVVWQSFDPVSGPNAFTSTVRGQQFSNTGARIGGELIISRGAGGEDKPVDIEQLADGRVQVAYTSYFAANSPSTTDLFAQTLDQRTAAIVVSTNTTTQEVIVGTAFADALYAYGAASGGDRLSGMDGDDLLISYLGMNTLRGGEGADQLFSLGAGGAFYGEGGEDFFAGGAGAESAFGGDGNDTLFGAGGNDILSGDGGVNVMDGGDGDDIIVADRSSLNLSGVVVGLGRAGNDSLGGGAQRDWLYGGDGNDTLSGGNGSDFLFGEAGNDSFDGGEGEDVAFGGDGNDTINGAQGADYLVGGDGNDSLRSGEGRDTLIGGTGDDELFSLTGNSAGFLAFGEDGNDTVVGHAGPDYFILGAGADSADGGAGNDTILGQDGADTITGGDGDDLIFSGTGGGTFNGFTGRNYVILEPGGTDTIVIGPFRGQTFVYGFEPGAGPDVIRVVGFHHPGGFAAMQAEGWIVDYSATFGFTVFKPVSGPELILVGVTASQLIADDFIFV